MVWCFVVWHGVGWCWCGVGVVWCGVMWGGVGWCWVVLGGLGWVGRGGMVWHGMGMGWNEMRRRARECDHGITIHPYPISSARVALHTTEALTRPSDDWPESADSAEAEVEALACAATAAAREVCNRGMA